MWTTSTSIAVIASLSAQLRTSWFCVALLCAACSSEPAPAGSAKTSAAPAATSSSAPPPAVSSSPAASSPGKDFVAGQQVQVTWKGADRASKSVKRSKDEAKKLASEVLERAKKGEDFVKLAKEYSDDPDAKDRDGSVGTVKRDDGKLPVYQQLFDLKVGELSGVIEAKTGFYVLKRTQ